MTELPEEIEKAMQAYENAVLTSYQPVQIVPRGAYLKMREWEIVLEKRQELKEVILKHIGLAWNYDETEN